MEALDLPATIPVTSGEPMQPDWHVRPFSPNDEDGLLALYQRAFRRPRDKRHWRWKLLGRKAPFNLMWVAVVHSESEAEAQEAQVVGHYGGIPIRLKLGDQVFDAVHAVEAMTDPSFRRKGMLTALGGAAHSRWADEGQRVVTGLPNDQWGTRNRALGYLPVFPLSWLRFPLHMERALLKREALPLTFRMGGYLPLLIGSAFWRAGARLINMKYGDSVQVELASADTDFFNGIWELCSRTWPNVQLRDSDWVRWRYMDAEPDKYEVAVAHRDDREGAKNAVGYVAYRVMEHGERRNGYIADIFVARGDLDAAWRLVSYALSRLSEQGAGTVMTLAAPGSDLYSYLRKFGFMPTKAETSFSFEIVPLDRRFDVSANSNPADWHLTGGDFDVI